jgi:integrase
MTPLPQLYAARDRLSESTFAPNTLAGYRYDWRIFEEWCGRYNLAPLPASHETISLWLTDQLEQGKKVSTVRRRAASVVFHHKRAGLASPMADSTWRLMTAASRIRAERPRQMKALTIEQLRLVCRDLAGEDTAIAIRNRAILAVGFASALRRSSLVSLQIEDVEITDSGVVLSIRREKQDRAGKGRLVGLPFGSDPATCPVRALERWIEVRGPDPGPLFRPVTGGRYRNPMSDEAVTKVVRESLRRVGIDPTGYGSHSLRAGFVTTAANAGVGEFLIASQTGHRSMEALRKYYRRTEIFKVNAAAMIGL